MSDGRALVDRKAHGDVLASRIDEVGVADRIDKLIELFFASESIALLNGRRPVL